MRLMLSGALAGVLFVGAVHVAAGTAPVATLAPGAPAVSLAVAAGSAPVPGVMPMGTPVTFRMAEAITTKDKTLETGYLAHLEVLEPVMLNGVVVIPAGSPAMAEITDVRNKGMWGKSGRITGRMLYVTVGDRKIRLRGVIDSKGQTGTAGVVASIALVPLAGFFTTGTSAAMPMGTTVKGFTDEDVTLTTN
ncbi:hypothetical protein [Novosphingobium sp.]|uniref:hypothetical protein n=1 Tax=Novosphingobium sp. TaxID=1874826 RepID=UPI003B5298CC